MGSQFFLVSGSSGVGLPPQYSLFGQIVKGLDVLDTMQNVPTGRGDPARTTDVVINSNHDHRKPTRVPVDRPSRRLRLRTRECAIAIAWVVR